MLASHTYPLGDGNVSLTRLGLDPSNLAHLRSITQHKHKNLNFNNASAAHLSLRGQ
jgi:hypothetical protein